MKTLFHAFIMCQSMFCSIPAPQIWDENAKDKMLLFLPAVGFEIGILWAAIGWLCSYFHLPYLVRGMVLCVYPFLVTGRIHLDGFMDVTDAVGSCRSLERRREILKDSHVGSFAVIGVVLLMLAQFAFFASAPDTADVRIMILVPAVSRCCSSVAVTVLKPMQTSQYAKRKASALAVAVLACQLALLLVVGFIFCGKYVLTLVGCLIGYAAALRHGYKSLDGMNGDISGYALTLGELAAIAVYALL